MITLIEARNFRCLQNIRQPQGPFHVLVGPNASGKTTFLDVVAFLGRLVSDGLDAAVSERTNNFEDLLWKGSGASFELAVEARIPQEFRGLLRDESTNSIRYEVDLALDRATTEITIRSEKVGLVKSLKGGAEFQQLPRRQPVLDAMKATNTIILKAPEGKDFFFSELNRTDDYRRGHGFAYKLGLRKSALGNLPEDETQFPVSTWFKRLLSEGVQQFQLNSLLIRKASPPGQVRGLKPDGSNLPWVVEALQRTDPERFHEWIAHLQTALPDLERIRIVDRPDDKHRYLMLGYRGGLEVPSWMASDGTLRLLALTLPAYLPEFRGVYLIEEPENGIHPRAVETMFQSLSSVYDAQILMATHSPVILSMVEADKVLCFTKTAEGATEIVRGDQHPALRDWRGETNLGVLFAGGVLG